MNPRMNPPPRGMGPMGSYGPGMRGGPPNNMGPSGGGPIPPMIGQRPWTPTSTPMNYSSSSPGSYGVSFQFELSSDFKLLILVLTNSRGHRHRDRQARQ